MPPRLCSGTLLSRVSRLCTLQQQQLQHLQHSFSTSATICKSPDRNRVRPPWKAYLFDLYTHLLAPKNNAISILFAVDGLSPSEWNLLRANMPQGSRVTFLRSGLLPPVVKKLSGELTKMPKNASKGSLGLVSVVAMDPPCVKAVLAGLGKSIRTIQARAAAAPGEQNKGEKKKAQKKIEVRMAYVDGQMYNSGELESFAMLPGLDGIRAQLVGVLETIPRQVVGAVDAKGGEVVRTLQGREMALESEEKK